MGIENRTHRRLKLTGLNPPARLYAASDRRELAFRHVDVSKKGLGLRIAEAFKPGDELMLQIDALEVKLQVRWGRPESDQEGLFRYGLFVINDDVDLEDIFFAHGCLDEDLEADADGGA